jgi:hypothetical protein
MKTFKGHFQLIKSLLLKKENFAFTRFSDGELRILQNLETRIDNSFYQIGEAKYQVAQNTYHPEDHKHWVPGDHEFHRTKLMDAFKHKQKNYYVGLSCRCCVGENDFNQQIDWRGEDDEFLTWSNLFVNSNYPLFMKEILPLFKNYKVVYIVNENANIDTLPFKVDKDFRVGYNCIINDYDLIENISKWIEDNNIEDYLFLFSASSLSNMLIHQLYSKYDKNTYMDIGTTLNWFLQMKGSRDYLNGGPTLNQTCIW